MRPMRSLPAALVVLSLVLISGYADQRGSEQQSAPSRTSEETQSVTSQPIASSSGAGIGATMRHASAVKLVRTQPAIVRVACKQAQEVTQVRVTCPTLIPATRYIRRTGLWGSLLNAPSAWAITFNNGDNGPGYLHWIAGGGTTKAIRYQVLGDSVNEVKGLPRLVSRRSINGYTVAIYEFPPYPAGGPNGGHTAAFVPCGRRRVFASIHGYGVASAVIAMALDLARRSGCR